MIGRAGRKGVDTEGESILLCRENERKKVEELVMSDLKPVKSCLIQENGETLCSSMKRAILEVIVSGVASSPEQVEKYAACTLLSKQMETTTDIENCIKFLEENEFIRLQHMDDSGIRYSATQLGTFIYEKKKYFTEIPIIFFCLFIFHMEIVIIIIAIGRIFKIAAC